MNILIIDTEQTYGDIGYMIINEKEVLVKRQLVIRDLFDLAPNNAGKKQKSTAYANLPKKTMCFTNYEGAFKELSNNIRKYKVNLLCTHNLAADRKVFNSWCSASGFIQDNPFTLIKQQLDSQEVVKFLTADNSTYSLEGFVRELGVIDFVQEHTGLADTELVYYILDAFKVDELNFWFLSEHLDLYKRYVNNDKTIEALLSGNSTSGQVGINLFKLGYASQITHGTSGKPLKTPHYTLNTQGRLFFNSSCNDFTKRKKAIRDKILSHFYVGEGQKIIDNENHPQHIEMCKFLDTIKTEYKKTFEAQYIASAKTQAESILNNAKSQANNIIVENNKLNKELKEKTVNLTELEKATMTRIKEAEEQSRNLILKNEKEAQHNLNLEINHVHKQLDDITKKTIADAEQQAVEILAQADNRVSAIIEERTLDTVRRQENAKHIESKAKRTYWASWVDRIFWPVLGLIIAGLSCLVYFVQF